jgi:DNA invertase Pin-like site-specific DNA recombinase
VGGVMNKRYIIYLRVSTKEQDLRTQEQKVLRVLKERFGENIEYMIFTDEISSRKPLNAREGMQAALKSLKRGDTLVALKIDRIARNESELHTIKDFLKNYDMEMIMIDQPELQTSAMFSLYAMFSAMEVKMIRERIEEKLHEKQERGERTGSVRYGFRLDEANLILVNGKKKGEKVLKEGMLIENDKEQQCLNHMYSFFDQGMSYKQVSDAVNAMGYTNRHGRPWNHAHVYQILIRSGRTRFREKVQKEGVDCWTHEQKLKSSVPDDKVLRKRLGKPVDLHQTQPRLCSQGTA